MLLPALLTFTFGLFFGSFLLVVATRTGQGTSWVKGRSKCDGCGYGLSWSELIPVLSYLLQKGRCRHCRMHLSLWYPLSELLTAVVFTVIVLTSLSPVTLVANLIIASCLLVIFFTDRSYEIIPVQAVVLATLTVCIYLLLMSPQLLLPHLLAGFGSGSVFLLIFLLTKGKGMGFGDVIYTLFMGFLLGFPSIFFGLYIAFLTGAIVSLLLVGLKKKKLRGGTVPFGPFLVLGTFIMMIWSNQVLSVVQRLLGIN